MGIAQVLQQQQTPQVLLLQQTPQVSPSSSRTAAAALAEGESAGTLLKTTSRLKCGNSLSCETQTHHKCPPAEVALLQQLWLSEISTAMSAADSLLLSRLLLLVCSRFTTGVQAAVTPLQQQQWSH